MEIAELKALAARPELATDWSEWYESVSRIEKERKDQRNLVKLMETHGLTEREASIVAYYSQIPKSSEHLRYLLTELLVNQVYDITEAPWERDYDDARIITKLLLGYGNRELKHNSFLYTYPDEVEALADHENAKQLGLSKDDLKVAAFFANQWDNRRGYQGTPRLPRRNSWSNLSQESPYYIEHKNSLTPQQ